MKQLLLTPLRHPVLTVALLFVLIGIQFRQQIFELPEPENTPKAELKSSSKIDPPSASAAEVSAEAQSDNVQAVEEGEVVSIEATEKGQSGASNEESNRVATDEEQPGAVPISELPADKGSVTDAAPVVTASLPSPDSGMKKVATEAALSTERLSFIEQLQTARMMAYRGNPVNALWAYQRLVEKYPEQLDARGEWADLLLRSQYVPQAMAQYELIVESLYSRGQEARALQVIYGIGQYSPPMAHELRSKFLPQEHKPSGSE